MGNRTNAQTISLSDLLYGGPVEGTTLRDALPNDWQYIDSLRKREGSALGFIPKDAYLSILEKKRLSARERFRYSRLLVTVDNGDLTGFCYVSYAEDWAKVFQICVQEDARRWHRALMMIRQVESDAERRQKVGITCRVAFDLESNFFWVAVGYEPARQIVSTWLNQRESKSKRPLWEYRKRIANDLWAAV